MIIAIPSYNRASLLVTNLLLPEAIIVIPKSQEESYKNAGHKNLVTIHDSQDGNISKKRNAILSLFGDRDDIVMLDDDIT